MSRIYANLTERNRAKRERRKLAGAVAPSESLEGRRAKRERRQLAGKIAPSDDPEYRRNSRLKHKAQKKELAEKRARALNSRALPGQQIAKVPPKEVAKPVSRPDYRLFPLYATSRKQFVKGKLPFLKMLEIETECRAKVGLGRLTIQERTAELEERLAKMRGKRRKRLASADQEKLLGTARRIVEHLLSA